MASVTLLSTGNVSTFFGEGSACGANCTIFGNNSGNSTSGILNVILGSGSGVGLNSSSNNNLILGSNAFLGSGINNINNIAIGNASMQGSIATNTVSDCVAIGRSTLSAITTGIRNTVIGATSGSSIDSATLNVLIGYAAGSVITTGSQNVIIGAILGATNITSCTAIGSAISVAGTKNIVIGDACIAQTENNVVIGSSCGTFSMGNENILVGKNNGSVFTSAAVNNVCIGNDLMSACFGEYRNNIVLGKSNMAGAIALGINRDNIILGFNSGNSMVFSNNNIILGSNAAVSMTTGDGNILIGQTTTAALTSGNFNICIGQNSNTLSGTTTNTINMGLGTVSREDNSLTLGFGTFALTRAYIQGIRNVTTNVGDAIPVVIDSSGQLGTTSSSRRYKDNITYMDEKSTDMIYQLKPATFTYKQQKNKSIQFGLIAEDVEKIDPRLVIYSGSQVETVKYDQLIPIMLNMIISQNKLILENKSRIMSLDKHSRI